MLFKSAFHQGIEDGSITLTFRAWAKPQARAGARQRFGASGGGRAGFLEIDAVDLVPASGITNAEARRAGFADRASLLEELGRVSHRRIAAGTKVYRVAFHYVERQDERARLAADGALSSAGMAELKERLERMDRRSAHGPWTRPTLSIIAKQPGVSASKLAAQLGRERLAFKADVRKLKALGLTISLETGYRLSPRGAAFLRRMR